jgi:hypothetical protein
MLMRGREDVFVRWHGGYEQGHDGKREVDLGASHHFGPNLTGLAGYRFTTEEHTEDRMFAGARYRLPYFVHATVTADSESDWRFELEKSLRLTLRWSLTGHVEYDTNTYGDWSLETAWTVSKRMGAIARYDSDHGLGVGLSLRL